MNKNLLTRKTQELKKYNTPSLEFKNFQTEDVVMASGEEIYIGMKSAVVDAHKNIGKNIEKEQIKKFKEKEKSAMLLEHNYDEVLKDSISTFFPATGHWWSTCFKRSKNLSKNNLPCHLRNNRWLSEMLYKEIIEQKGIRIPKNNILEYINNSGTFKTLRHNYELEIVKWQIEWIKGGGENWILPDGFGDADITMSDDCDICFREGVIATLTAIGMDEEVIEEGLEKNAHLWRDFYFRRAFRNVYQPIGFLRKTQLQAPTEAHKKNWLKNREYEYYLAHKYSVLQYGKLTPAMQMTEEEYCVLQLELKQQNTKRQAEIDEWNKMDNDYISIIE